MTTKDIHNITREANAICAAGNLRCVYGYDRKRGEFAWMFFRGDVFVGSTATQSHVLTKARQFVSTK